MRRLSTAALLLALAAGWAAAGAPAAADEAAIRGAVLDYLEGWYDADPARMERALHPDLTKRGVRSLPNGRTLLGYASASMMVEYTRLGSGKLPPEERAIEVTILDSWGSMAAVKAVSAKFVDYCQLAKCDGEWKIVNVLWESLPEE